jgi:hypothetical protein
MTTTRTPTFDEVLNAYCKFAIRTTFEESESKEQEQTIRCIVKNLQRNDAENERIYELLAEMNPLLGCPLTFYQDSVLPFDDAIKKAETAKKKFAKRASDAASRARSNLSNKRKRIEPEQRVTTDMVPRGAARPVRDRNLPSNFAQENVPPSLAAVNTLEQPEAIHEILALGYAGRREGGWRAKDLGVDGEGNRRGRKSSDRFESLLCQDARELKEYLKDKPELSRYNERCAGNNKFKARKKNEFNPITLIYLTKSWGVGRNFIDSILKREGQPKKPKVRSSSQLCVIDSLESAKAKYTAKNLFMASRVRERTGDNELLVYESLRQGKHVFREESKADWVLLPQEQKDCWECTARNKVAMQPQIRGKIIEALRANPPKSYEKIAEEIDHWCTTSTINLWHVKNLDLAFHSSRRGGNRLGLRNPEPSDISAATY